MSKSDQIALGRNQGLDLARRIVAQAQEDGADPLRALDMEIRNRHIIGIAAKMTRSEWEKEFVSAMELAYKAAMVIAMAVLWGDFGWGGAKRLPKFCSAYLNYLMEIGKGNTSITELVDLLADKAGVHVDLAEKGFTADFRKAKGKDRIA